MTRLVTLLLLLGCYCTTPSHQRDLNFVIYHQSAQDDLPFLAETIFKDLDTNVSRSYLPFSLTEKLEDFQSNFCSQLAPSKFNIILDLVWNRNPRIRQLANAFEIPYFKVDATIYPLMEPVVQFIRARNGTESIFVLPKEELIDQAMFGLVENSRIKFMLVTRLGKDVAEKLLKKRPIAEENTIIARTDDMNEIFQQAIDNNLVRFPDRWTLMFLDSQQNRFRYHESHPDVSKVVLDSTFYCQWFPEMRGKSCEWPSGPFDHLPLFLRAVLSDLFTFYKSTAYPLQKTTACNKPIKSLSPIATDITVRSELDYFTHLLNHPLLFVAPQYNQIKFKLDASIYQTHAQLGETQLVANYSALTGHLTNSTELRKPRRYMRIGTAYALPFSTYKLDPVTQQPLKDAFGAPIWEGYCVDLMARFAEIMDINYDFVEPASKTMGSRHNGKWDGTVGDLVSGETDFIVAALVTTAEREEVIDFVSPIFEETGISIVIRKPVRTTSLFRFMTVLRTEVWIAIVISLIVSACLLCLLDKYSPHSGQNRDYPTECRHFSLKESFWFALTSYTPQGGGELPKALSGRTLVATYWLFVVLILATFTANLAAFLTVQRMNTPVSSLEQLGKQSRINYTVVEGSDAHKYFINMKFAEDLMYEAWKNTSMVSTVDQHKYQVWDYPVQEQYGLMLRAINTSGPVKSAREGFQNVMDHENADYAFIHDSREIKYEIVRNCDLTEIGEVFGKRPYGLAVPHGNRALSDEVTKAMLQLQHQRFFDALRDKYWNASIGNCDLDENEGMTLESLGGVFIVTIFGLVLAGIALLLEWFYYWKNTRDLTRSFEARPEEGGQGGGEEESSSPPEHNRSVLRKRNLVGVADGIEPGHAFGVFKRSVSIVEDHNEQFD